LSPPAPHKQDEERIIDRDPRESMPPRLAPSTALVPGSFVVLALLAGLGLVAYALYALIQAQRG
jgi:hypothetical protein